MPNPVVDVLGQPVSVRVDDPHVFFQVKIAMTLTGNLGYCAEVHPKYGEILGPVIALHPEICQVSILVQQQNGRTLA